jgi:hypothetical protein
MDSPIAARNPQDLNPLDQRELLQIQEAVDDVLHENLRDLSQSQKRYEEEQMAEYEEWLQVRMAYQLSLKVTLELGAILRLKP